jgi:hypothetical protein
MGVVLSQEEEVAVVHMVEAILVAVDMGIQQPQQQANKLVPSMSTLWKNKSSSVQVL